MSLFRASRFYHSLLNNGIHQGGLLLRVGSYLGWAHTQGGLLHGVGSYSGWALTWGGLLLRVGIYTGWALTWGGLLLRVDLYSGWVYTQGGLLLRVGSYSCRVGFHTKWVLSQRGFYTRWVLQDEKVGSMCSLTVARLFLKMNIVVMYLRWALNRGGFPLTWTTPVLVG